MSSRYFNDFWRECVSELVRHLDAEHPAEKSAMPKTLDDWARLYIGYVGTLRKLCTVHEGMVQPQMRLCVQSLLEACMGRVLEVRAHLTQLNAGRDVLDFGPALSQLKLSPLALELPVPVYFRAARAQQVALVAAAAAAARAGGSGGTPDTQADLEMPDIAAGQTAAEETQETTTNSAVTDQDRSDAAHEQGQLNDTLERHQGQQEHCELPADTTGTSVHQLSPEQQQMQQAAAVKLQAAGRGWLARQQLTHLRRRELEFLGMLPPLDASRSQELQRQAADICGQRRGRQVAEQRRLDEALLEAHATLRQQEGFLIKEQIREKLHDWFLSSGSTGAGEYADLPDAGKGGSRDITHPSPPQPSAEATAAAARMAKASRPNTAKPASSSSRGGTAAQAVAAPLSVSQVYVELLRDAVQQYMDIWHEYQPADPTLATLPPALQGLPPPKGGSAPDRYDAAMVAEEVRPVVYEEMRVEADEEMRGTIRGIKETLRAKAAERARLARGKAGQAGKGPRTAGAAAAKKPAAAAPAAALGAKQSTTQKAMQKKRRDPSAGCSMESIFAELAAAGLVSVPPPCTLAEFLGGDRLSQGPPPSQHSQDRPRTGGKKANAALAAGRPATGKGRSGAGGKEAPHLLEPSLAQARQAVVATCVLPLGGHPRLNKVSSLPRTVLLYGPAGTGKTMLCRAAAHEAGAPLFELSPAATAGKYPGKDAALLVHLVFKAARALAPSIVLVEDVDHVFITDRERCQALAGPGCEPPARIRKALVEEVAELQPGDGVLVLCTSRQPQACLKRDEHALRAFIQRCIEVPLPDYVARQTLLHSFAEAEGLALGTATSLLAHLTPGLSAGQLKGLVHRVASRLRGVQPGEPPHGSTAACRTALEPCRGAGRSAAMLRPEPAAIREAALEALPDFAPASSAEVEELREWSTRVQLGVLPEVIEKRM